MGIKHIGMTPVEIQTLGEGERNTRQDWVATEEPLEIRVMDAPGAERGYHSLAVTMRTPGDDLALTAGFLFSEGIVTSSEDIIQLEHCVSTPEESRGNIVNVRLANIKKLHIESLSRHVYTSSSCGVCGKAVIETIFHKCSELPIDDFRISRNIIPSLFSHLAEAQEIFSTTGGLHATALYSETGELILLREDVGRHNAMDKVIGYLLMRKELPASRTIVLVSGRASFELVQKAILAGIPIMVSIGAPSSLAVKTARRFNMTLVGFVKGGRFNIYASPERIL
ncbi:MAG: formate dehydrogenase accessory sulfurtransferase FdhD [Calditrichaeota bacterium]|nr:MAG: formate dehydrogenase accessory sulfurtransferase FdhD [Calditrichota bacterium]